MAGSWLNSGSAVAAEIAALAGFDWLLIDREHGSGGEVDAGLQMMAVEAGESAPVVRVSGIDPAEVKRMLDLGPAGIMVPCIDTVEQAAEVVKYVRLPPLGVRQTATSTRAVQYGRGYRQYVANNNQELVLMVQIESGEAVRNAPAIAAMEGIDVLFVGPTDLRTDMGIEDGVESLEFREALAAVVKAARTHGKGAGILARNEDQVRTYVEMGFRVIAMGSDRGILATGFDKAARSLAALRTPHRAG